MWVSVPFLQHIHADYDFRRFTGQGLTYEVEKAGFRVDQLHGSYGIVDSTEYLLYAAVGWRVKDKDYKSMSSAIYILVLAMLFFVFKVLGVLFNSQQKKDMHHATSFKILAHKD